MRRTLALSLLSCALAAPLSAGASGDAMALLGRMATAARTLNFSGTFIYQSGGQSETSRVTHAVDGGVEREKLEVLDGSPREVVRSDNEIQCFLPAEHTVIVERHARKKLLPARLPDSLSSLPQFYGIRIGKPGRVAGFDTQLVVLEPKDDLRYGHLFWVESNSGLLVKAHMVNEQGQPIEQFAFTQLQIGGTFAPDALKSKFSSASGEWRVHDAGMIQSAADDEDWIFRASVPGFERSAGMKRRLKPGAPESTHYVFSDGMASVSIFIEKHSERADKIRRGFFRTGATNVYQRLAGDYAVTALGEVPLRTLKALSEGIEPRRK